MLKIERLCLLPEWNSKTIDASLPRKLRQPQRCAKHNGQCWAFNEKKCWQWRHRYSPIVSSHCISLVQREPGAHNIGLWCTLKYTEFDHTSRFLPSYALIFCCSICSFLADSLSGFWAQKWPAFITWNEMETTTRVNKTLLVNVNKHWNKSLYEKKRTQGMEEAAWGNDRLVRARDLESRGRGFKSYSDT